MFVQTDERPAGEAVALLPQTTPSLEGFAQWLEARNPGVGYNWHSCDECATAQYARAIGYPDRGDWQRWAHVALTDTPEGRVLAQLNGLSMGPNGGRNVSVDWTYGACLGRVREAMATAA